MESVASDKAVGRAEAMRQSMLAQIDKGKAYEASRILGAIRSGG
jgi:hypothetical protein